jgi:hypothetical protein
LPREPFTEEWLQSQLRANPHLKVSGGRAVGHPVAQDSSGETIPPSAPTGKSKNTSTPRMNKTEARFAALLEGWKREGAVLDYKFEAVTLRLAPSTHYRTDFVAWLSDGRTRFYEVKGGYVREDAWLKLKTVAVLFPRFEFVCAQWKGGEWNYISIPSS